MSKQTNRILSESDKALLADYLHLTPENRELFRSYLAALSASPDIPAPAVASPR